jgi:hypothetical protein
VRLAQLDRAAAGDHAAAAHVLTEGGQGQLLRDLRLADEGSGALAPLQVAVTDEIVERGADGETGDAELAAQAPLGRNRLADLQLVDQLEHALSGQDLFLHDRQWKHSDGHMVKTTPPQPASFSLLDIASGLCQSLRPWVVV